MPALTDLMVELKDNVVAEERLIAKENFKGREKSEDENFSEYRLALQAEASVAYEGYDEEELDEKVLERFLDGIGKAGESVRLQAPKTMDEAISKAIAYENEQKRNRKEKERVYAFKKRSFQGMCFKCNQRGHKANECPETENAQSSNAQSSQRYEGRRREPRRCYVCGSTEHVARECPQKK